MRAEPHLPVLTSAEGLNPLPYAAGGGTHLRYGRGYYGHERGVFKFLNLTVEFPDAA